MKNEKISFVFFGSGPVATESLKLLQKDFSIEAVVTKTTTKKEISSIVSDVPVYLADNKQSLEDLFTTTKFKSDVAVLIDFGVILSNKVISYFPKGIVNSHFSLLPELRGADPISFAILEGKERTGVSLMLLVEAMDEGPIISIGMFDLDGTETGVSLTQELIQLSHKLLVENLPAYISGNISAVTQEVTMEKFNLQTSYTRKLTKQDGVIDWNKPANMIEREVRAFKDWPKSRTNFSDIEVILLETQVVESKDTTTAPGAIETTDKELVIKCGEDSLQINRLKPVGKKDMDAQSFLAGYKQRIMS